MDPAEPEVRARDEAPVGREAGKEAAPCRGRGRAVLLEHVAHAGIGELELVDGNVAQERRPLDGDDATAGRVTGNVLDLDPRERRRALVDQLEPAGGMSAASWSRTYRRSGYLVVKLSKSARWDT